MSKILRYSNKELNLNVYRYKFTITIRLNIKNKGIKSMDVNALYIHSSLIWKSFPSCWVRMLLKLWGTYNVGVVGEHSVLFDVDLLNIECLDVNLLLQHDSFV